MQQTITSDKLNGVSKAFPTWDLERKKQPPGILYSDKWQTQLSPFMLATMVAHGWV